MKKVVLFLSVVALTASTSFAQKADIAGLKAKIAKSDETIANSKKNGKSATWLTRGLLFNSVVTAASSDIYVDMAETLLVQTAGKPLNAENITVETINGQDFKKFEYPSVDVYLTSAEPSMIAFWLEKETADADAPVKAAEAFSKALELDPKSKDKVAEGYAALVEALAMKGQNYYDALNYTEASKYFKLAAETDYKNPNGPTSTPDDLLYFSAVACAQGGDNEASAEMFKNLIEKGIEQDGEVYFYAGLVFEKIGDKDSAKAYMEQGIEKYLDNQRLLQQYITFSLQNNAGAEAVMPYITKAQEKDPKNPVYIVAEGIVYNQAKDYDKAIAAYERAIALDEKNYGALYNLGFAYRAKAIEINAKLGGVDYTNTKVIDQLKADFVASMKAAIVPFEKAHELQPKDKVIVEVLKSIFFSLRDEGDDMLAGYKKYDELFKTL